MCFTISILLKVKERRDPYSAWFVPSSMIFVVYFFPSENRQINACSIFRTVWQYSWNENTGIFAKISRSGKRTAETFSSRARARSKFFRSKASQNSLASGDSDDDAKLAQLTAQFRGRDDAKKKEQDSKRKERSGDVRGRGTRERKKEGGYIGRNIYESSSMHPHPKVAPVVESSAWVCVSYEHVCSSVHTRVLRVWNETWQRRLECSLGTHESPTRRARPPGPPAATAVLSRPRPLLVTGRNEGQGRWRLPGRNWNSPEDFFFIFARRILSLRFFPPHLCTRETLCSRNFLSPVRND